MWGFYDILVVVDERLLVLVWRELSGHRTGCGAGRTYKDYLWYPDLHPQITYVIGEEIKIQRSRFPYPGSHSMLVSEPGQEFRLPAKISLAHPWLQL